MFKFEIDGFRVRVSVLWHRGNVESPRANGRSVPLLSGGHMPRLQLRRARLCSHLTREHGTDLVRCLVVFRWGRLPLRSGVRVVAARIRARTGRRGLSASFNRVVT